MERKFLEDLGFEKEVIDKVMAENGKDIEKAKQPAGALQATVDTLTQQLKDAGEVIKGFEGKDIAAIEKAAADWEQKYTTETQALKDQLADQGYAHTVESSTAGITFSSTAARKAFVADLTAKKLPLEEGKLLGFDDYVKAYREADPDAFKSDAPPPPQFTAGAAPPAKAGSWRDNLVANMNATQPKE